MIVNIKETKAYDIYCGRGNKTYDLPASKWANPFVIGKDGDRDTVIDKYRIWISSQPNLLRQLSEIKDKVLGCWCKPLKCHCEILEKMANSRYILNWFSNMIPCDKPFIYRG